MAARQFRQMVGYGLTAVLIALLTGCASLDPSQDVQKSGTLVEARTGFKPDWHIPWAAQAEVWDGHSKLTLNQAVILALRNNRSIQARLEDIAGARADLVQSGLLPNPVVSIAYGFPLGGGAGGATFGASAIQEFTALWLRPSRMKAADAQLRSQILGVSQDGLRLVADVKQAHTRIAFAQRAIALLLSQIELGKQATTVTGKQVAAGQSTQLDVNRNQLLILSLQSQLVEQRAALAKEKTQLLCLMGRSDMIGDWDIAEAQAHSEIPNLNESEVIVMLSQRRLDVAAARFVYESKVQDLQLEHLGQFPTIALGAGIQRENDGGKELGPNASFTLPLLDQNQAKIARAASALRKAKLDTDRTLQEAIKQARLAWTDWQAKQSQIRLYQDQLLGLAKQNMELSQKARQAGAIDQTVFLEAQRGLIMAQSSLLGLERDMELSRIELEFTVGGTLQPTPSSPVASPPATTQGTATRPRD